MSAPFGINITIISGRRYSGEIVAAAASFLSMDYLDISPVATDLNVRPEFLKALGIFEQRERLDYRKQPGYFVEKLTEPGASLPSWHFFWLALDPEGEVIARKFLDANGVLPDKRAHQSVRKLNLIEPVVAPPPDALLPLSVWEKSRLLHDSLSFKYRREKVKQPYTLYMNENVALLPEQKLYFAWCESLYGSLIPWQDAIRCIQSDLS
jgi:hypothetical protein